MKMWEKGEISEFEQTLHPRDYRVFAGVIDLDHWPAWRRLLFKALGGHAGDHRPMLERDDGRCRHDGTLAGESEILSDCGRFEEVRGAVPAVNRRGSRSGDRINGITVREGFLPDRRATRWKAYTVIPIAARMRLVVMT